MEDARKPSQPLPLAQTNSAQASATEQCEPLPKKDYQPPKLELLGNVSTVTAAS